jgi:hypothetical protein
MVADLSLDKDGRGAWRMERVDPAGLPGAATRHVVLPLLVSSPRTAVLETTDQGDLPDAGALWLSAGSRAGAEEDWRINHKKTYRV